MKELFKSLNNVSIDCDDYDAGELTELEKQQMKKRIAQKLKIKPGIARRVIAAAAVLALLSFGFALQAIPMELGPRLPLEDASMNWLQVGFVVMQQMCYFGVHGFSLKAERH